MKLLIFLLLSFFRLRADDPKEVPVEIDPADIEDPDPGPEHDPDEPDPNADEPQVTTKEELETARREAKTARDDAERYQRELAQARAERPAPRQDDETSREDARLAAADTPELEKWQIRANRELRAGRSAAQAALMQAEDVRDQTAFSQLAITEPALHKRYTARVEEELGNARKQGYNPRREVIYNQLIAKDMRDGKFKKKAAASDDSKVKTVPRGKTPGVKSDVGARGGQSEHEKRRARLENVQI